MLLQPLRGYQCRICLLYHGEIIQTIKQIFCLDSRFLDREF